MELDIEQLVREYIDKTIHMSLATVSGDRPWVCEVHFVYDDNLNLYFRSLTSRRHSQEIAGNPNVAGNIVRQHALGEDGHGIYFEGTAAVIDPAERAQVVASFKSRLNAPASLDDPANDNGHEFYKISVANWYAFGKFGLDKSNKYLLEWNGGKTA